MKKKRYLYACFSLVLLSTLVVIIPSCSSLGTAPSESEQRRFEMSDHFDKNKKVFLNRDAFKRMDKRKKFESGGWIKFFFGNDNKAVPKDGLPVLTPDLSHFKAPSDKMKVIWFGHSTFMLNLKGRIFLIDPILTNHASPVPLVIKRFQPPPLNLKELPEVDTVLISHDHYDHLDMNTIKSFLKKKTKFIVPLGVGSHLIGWGIESERITELDWWGSTEDRGFEFIATPAQHFSGRTLGSRNATLWAGWIIKCDDKKIFYSGDSGYDIHFKEIGEKYGPFDVAFLENGQYNKAWEEVHLLPEQGVKAYYDLRANIFFPVHWGAFKLSIHSWFEPIRNVYQSSLARNFPLVAPKIGEVVELDEYYKQAPWWEEFIKD